MQGRTSGRISSRRDSSSQVPLISGGEGLSDQAAMKSDSNDASSGPQKKRVVSSTQKALDAEEAEREKKLKEEMEEKRIMMVRCFCSDVGGSRMIKH